MKSNLTQSNHQRETSGSAQDNRRGKELMILQSAFPPDSFVWQTDGNKEWLDMGVKTQSNAVYRLKITIPSDYPYSPPAVWVVHPNPLRSHSGSVLEPSVETHTLRRDREGIQICLYYDGMVEWNPQYTLYHAVLKARAWLECYEAHLRTGKSIYDIAGKSF
ncbi:MAG: hypothetical protein RMM16_11255 [Chloroherpetonaceae bacterium]|nr:hypothetical protein [Chloroherpetonaceae bacterium]